LKAKKQDKNRANLTRFFKHRSAILTLTITKHMENTLELNTPTQTLHLAVDIEIQNQPNLINKALKKLLSYYCKIILKHFVATQQNKFC